MEMVLGYSSSLGNLVVTFVLSSYLYSVDLYLGSGFFLPRLGPPRFCHRDSIVSRMAISMISMVAVFSNFHH